MKKLNWFQRTWKKAKERARAIWISLLAAFSVVVTGVALAEINTLTWINADTYEDGTPMPVEEIAETRIYRSVQPLDNPDAERTYVQIGSAEGAITDFDDDVSLNGYYCYVLTHVATNGAESLFSNEACKTVDARVPSPPRALTVN